MASSEPHPFWKTRRDTDTPTSSSSTSQQTTHTTSSEQRTTLSSQVKGKPVATTSKSTSTSSSISTSTSPSASLLSSTPPPIDSQTSTNTGVGPTSSLMPASATQTDGASASGLSTSSKNAIIASTTIAGVLIIALLIYAIWRMCRRGGDKSDTITVATSAAPRMTALPIYIQNRYSVHSSRIGSKFSLGKSRRERFDRDHPWAPNQHAWKTQNPPTPITEGHPLGQVMNAPPSPPLKELGMTRVYSGQAIQKRAAKHDSEETTKSGVAVAVQPASGQTSPTESVFGLPPKSLEPPPQAKDRWSWTNADAPPTPRLGSPSIGKSSVSSLPKFRRVGSWVRHQAARQNRRTEEPPPPVPSLPSSATTNVRKGSKSTILAGPPTRKESFKRQHKKTESSLNALQLREAMDKAGITEPEPVILNPRRPSPPPPPSQHSDNLFISYS